MVQSTLPFGPSVSFESRNLQGLWPAGTLRHARGHLSKRIVMKQQKLLPDRSSYPVYRPTISAVTACKMRHRRLPFSVLKAMPVNHSAAMLSDLPAWSPLGFLGLGPSLSPPLLPWCTPDRCLTDYHAQVLRCDLDRPHPCVRSDSVSLWTVNLDCSHFKVCLESLKCHAGRIAMHICVLVTRSV